MATHERMSKTYLDCVRPDIQNLPQFLPPSADEPPALDQVVLSANENCFGSCIFDLFDEQLVDEVNQSSGSNGASPSSVNSHQTSSTNSGSDGSSATGLSKNTFYTQMMQMLSSLHRYPGPTQTQLKRDIAKWRGLPSEDYVALGLGAVDLADHILKATCEAKVDGLLVTPPTFALFEIRAIVNDIPITEVPLELRDNTFVFKLDRVKEAIALNPSIKVIMLDSPGNPTGTLIPFETIRELLTFVSASTVVVIDEAYIDLADDPSAASALPLIHQHPNLIVLNTFSKAQGLPGIRLASAYAQPYLISNIHKVQLPYLVSSPTSLLARLALTPAAQSKTATIRTQILQARKSLLQSLSSPALQNLGLGPILGGNQANFVLVPVKAGKRGGANERAVRVVTVLEEKYRVSIKFLGVVGGVEGCLRIAVGTDGERERLVEGLEGALRMTEEGEGV